MSRTISTRPWAVAVGDHRNGNTIFTLNNANPETAHWDRALIEQAPDLLKNLKLALIVIQNAETGGSTPFFAVQKIIIDAERTIAKAEGK